MMTNTFVQLGWFNAMLYLLARGLAAITGRRWTLFRYRFVAQPIGDTPLILLRGADIEIRLPAAHEALPPDYPRPANVIGQRYAQGARALTAWRKGRLAGFLWLIQSAYQEDEVRVRYLLASPHTSWDFDVWVRPEERLGWVFRKLWEAARLDLRQRDIQWSCSRISAFNAASLRAHASMGAVNMGSATFLRCGAWQWMLASLPPYFHLSRHPASYPQLTFQEPSCPLFNKSARS